MDAQWDVLVLGGINTDYIIQTIHLPKPGETVLGSHFQEQHGGKGANQAVAAARLNAKVALLGKVGDDKRGKDILKNLEQENVSISLIQKDNTAKTGVALISIADNGEKQIIVSPEANFSLLPHDIHTIADTMSRSRVFLTQCEVPMPTVLFAIELAAKAKIQIILDAGPAQDALPSHIYPLIDIIRLNTIEAQMLTKISISDQHSARKAAYWLLNKGVKAAIVQADSQGDIVVSDGQEIWLPRFTVKSIDCTGAGDAFVAALAVSLAEKKPLKEAALLGSIAAALSTTVLGAQAGLPKRSLVEDFLRRHKI